MAVKLAKTSKMPCKSWSLQALEACPGSVADGGGLVDACKGCYAVGGFYRMPGAVAARQHNREDWRRDDWVEEMVEAIGNDPYFRWFDSGDMYDLRLAYLILQVVILTPNTKHWIPTRMYKFPKFHSVITNLNARPNCVVRFSSDSVVGDLVEGPAVPGPFESTIWPREDMGFGYTAAWVKCKAYTRGGKCGDCRACWSRDVELVVYPAHGASMQKVIRLKVA